MDRICKTRNGCVIITGVLTLTTLLFVIMLLSLFSIAVIYISSHNYTIIIINYYYFNYYINLASIAIIIICDHVCGKKYNFT